jgi:hypothetical protein
LIPIALNSCPSFHRRIIIKADRKGTYIWFERKPFTDMRLGPIPAWGLVLINATV